LRVVVDAPPALGTSDEDRVAPRAASAVETGWDSATERWTSAVDASATTADRVVRLHVVNVTQRGPTNGDARTAFPSATVAVEAGGRQLALLDAVVDHSPLSVAGSSLRGVHVRGRSLELHAGYASPLLYRSILLPSGKEAAIGASYRFALGPALTVAPVAYHFPYASSGGTRGTMGSLVVDHGLAEGPLRLRGELGYGGELGGAVQLAAERGANRVWVDARHQPSGFASLGVGRPLGTFVDVASSTALPGPFVLNAAASTALHELVDLETRRASGSGELRWLFHRGWSAWSGVAGGSFRGSGEEEPLRTLTIPVGLAWEGSSAGGAAAYRFQRSSARNEGGHGGRLSVRGGSREVRVSAYADLQQDAATADLVLSEVPGLSRALDELGIAARTPDDLVRIIRETPALAELGIVRGAALELHPWRAQTGLELTASSRDRGERLRVQVTADRARAIKGLDQSILATASYSRRVGPVEALAGATWWAREREGAAVRGTSYGLGLRVAIDRLARLPSPWRRGAIRGVVLREEGSAREPLAGARVRLDGVREVLTGADGSFSFDAGEGEHRVEALLPPGEDAYFTTPSLVRLRAGQEARFVVATLPARLVGAITNDAGAPLAEVTVRLSRPGEDVQVTTDSSGAYAFAVAPGAWMLELDAGSVPAGHDVAAAAPREVELTRGNAARAYHGLAASRSIAGTLRGSGVAGTPVTLLETGRAVRADSEGRYVFRQLAPGTYTVRAKIGRREARRTVDVPPEPAAIRGVDLEPVASARGKAP
jgi:hypothetical protein